MSEKVRNKSRNIVKHRILSDQTNLVSYLLAKSSVTEFNLAYVFNYHKVYEQELNIFHWYLVDESFAETLKEKGEPILENEYGTWWGRTTTGQRTEDDAVIQEIVKERTENGQ